ncbi:kinase-like protein [Hypomontagnella submonticulosa]|nr:kinase-like protein [Hypomontagnella submonticulosa]
MHLQRQLTIKITQVQNLNRHYIESYLVVTFQKNELVSKPMSSTATTHPSWDLEATFDVVEGNSVIDISGYSRYPFSNSKFDKYMYLIGHLNIEPNIFKNNDAPISGWYTLQAPSLAHHPEQAGEIHIDLKFQPITLKRFGADDFRICRPLGEGKHGQAYQVQKKDTKRFYAMKVLAKKAIAQSNAISDILEKRDILVRAAQINSPFVLGLKFSFQTQSNLFLITDYMSGGSLSKYLEGEGHFPPSRVKFYVAELILALESLHSHSIVCLNLNCDSILLDATGHVALCDFGITKTDIHIDKSEIRRDITEYLAPEVINQSGQTKAADYWSLGVISFEMALGWSPFWAEDTEQIVKNICLGKTRLPRGLASEERDFIKGLLNRNPTHRLGNNMGELKNHRFLVDINWDAMARRQVAPPWIPPIYPPGDFPYPEAGSSPLTDLDLQTRALNAGIAMSTPLSYSTQAHFQGFTFVDNKAIGHSYTGGEYLERVLDDTEDWDDDRGTAAL